MNDGKYLKLLFAMSAHEGSVRCIDIASSISTTPSTKPLTGLSVIEPGTLLSGGYDESINVYNILKKNQIGELRTPPDLGSPTCCSFAPPSNNNNIVVDAEDVANGGELNQTSTHAVIGTTSGKIIIYKRRDWSVQHVLSGHGGSSGSSNTGNATSSTTAASGSGGVACLAIHPTGKMALSGGRSDGKIILWDLVKGRLAYVHKIPNNKSTLRNNGNSNGSSNGSRRAVESINHIVWSNNGARYAYCYGSHITARDANTGETLLDVNMYPCPRVNQLTFVGGDEGLFVAAACDDGSLPVLEVGRLLLDDVNDDDDDDDDSMKKEDKIRRAIMAIEPVSGPIAGDDRFKCIRSVVGGSGFLVVTANSGGVISLMDLEGAARMMLTPNEENDDEEDDSVVDKDDDDSDIDSDDDDDEEVEAAVEILDSVRVGSGARITDLAVWSYGNQDGGHEEEEDDDNVGDSIDEGDDDDENESLDSDEVTNRDEDEKEGKLLLPPKSKQLKYPITKAKGQRYSNKEQTIELNAEAIEKARKLVGQAKEHQKKATKKRKLSNKKST
jgi:WD40 repeat protein